MSSGAFDNSKYESNSGVIYFAKVQPETLAATIGGTANAEPAGSVTGEPSAKMSGGRREIGVIARRVSVAWDDGGAPAGYEDGSSVSIPIMTPTLFDSISRGDAVSYNGGSGTVSGKTPEVIN
jgi:hypothetical protein